MIIKIQKGDITSTAAEAVVLFHFERDDKLLESAVAVNTVTGSIVSRVIEAYWINCQPGD